MKETSERDQIFERPLFDRRDYPISVEVKIKLHEVLCESRLGFEEVDRFALMLVEEQVGESLDLLPGGSYSRNVQSLFTHQRALNSGDRKVRIGVLCPFGELLAVEGRLMLSGVAVSTTA